MRKYYSVLLVLCVLCLFIGSSSADQMPTGVDLTDIESFLGSSYFNGYESVGGYDFSGEWNYTAIAFESGNTNWVKEAADGPVTFSTANQAGFGIYDTVNFDVANLFFSDSDGPFNQPLDTFSLSGAYFKLFKLTADSEELSYLGTDLVLFKGTIIVGFNDNFIDSSGNDSDFDDIIVAMAPAPVPEPATMLLLGTGLLGIAGIGRKKLKK